MSQENSQTQIAQYTNQHNLVSKMNGVMPFNIKKTTNKKAKGDMESEAREHLNLANYNFNKMTVIDEEDNEFL